MQYRRVKQPGASYFFTLVTWQRQRILTLPENITRLRTAFQREREKNPFSIDAIVILPDHLHTLWQLPKNDMDYSGRWNRIKGYFSRGCIRISNSTTASRSKKRELPVWQRRFWEHCIRNEADWHRHMDYIHYNPVKHGLIPRPADWPYSSFNACVNKGWYQSDWGRYKPEHIRDMNYE